MFVLCLLQLTIGLMEYGYGHLSHGMVTYLMYDLQL